MFIMLDTETLATSANAVVISMGAIAFCPQDGVEPIKFYSKVSLHEQAARMIEPDIVARWMRRAQEDDRVIEVFDGLREPVGAALERLSTYMDAYLTPDGEVWGDGLDCVAVRTLYEEFGIALPWRSSQHRCLRTLRNLVRQLNVEVHVSHDISTYPALDDAEWNARFVMASMNSLRQHRLGLK